MRYVKNAIFFLFVFGMSVTLSANNGSLEFSGNNNGGYKAFAEQMPEVVGGIKAIYKNIKEYPPMAREAKVEGKVYVLAFVNEKGGVDDVKLVRGIGAGCDEAAIDAVKNVKFKAGKTQGKNIKVKMTIAIVFKLS